MSTEHGWEREPAEIPPCPGCEGEGHLAPPKQRHLKRFMCHTCKTLYDGVSREWDEWQAGREMWRKWKAEAE